MFIGLSPPLTSFNAATSQSNAILLDHLFDIILKKILHHLTYYAIRAAILFARYIRRVAEIYAVNKKKVRICWGINIGIGGRLATAFVVSRCRTLQSPASIRFAIINPCRSTARRVWSGAIKKYEPHQEDKRRTAGLESVRPRGNCFVFWNWHSLCGIAVTGFIRERARLRYSWAKYQSHR
jgi:hypothetical protein